MWRPVSAILKGMRGDLASLRLMFDPAAPPAADFETFRRDTALMTSRLVLVGAAASILLWMPTDPIIYGSDPPLVWMVVSFRIAFIALAGLMYLAALRTPREHALGTVMAFAVIMVTFAFCMMGFMAKPSVPFAFTSFFVPSITMVFPYTFRERTLAAFVSSSLALIAYYAPHPEYMAVGYTGIVFVFLAFTTVSSVGFGHLLFLFQQGMFVQRRQAQKQALELEEANRTKDTFVATVSHELRTPMNAILGLADAITEEEDLKNIHKYARTIQHSGDLLLALINDILDLAKIRAGRLELDLAPTNVAEVVERSASLFSVQCRTKGVRLTVQLPDALPFVEIDSGRFQQILTNLMGNAVKFTERGEIGIRVTIERDNTGAAALKLDVLDTGPGVPAEKHEAIFQEFVRVESNEQRYAGTGLGLPIVRRLARLMGGDVTLAANPGGGSIFTLTLPVKTVDDTGSELAPRASGNDRWFVICASDGVRRIALWELLSREKLRGNSANSLAAAAEMVAALRAANRPLAGVFVDDPELTPAALAASPLVGADGQLAVPVVVLRDGSGETDRAAFAALGVRKVLQKPVATDEVEALLRPDGPLLDKAPPQVGSPLLPAQRVLVIDDVAENRLVMEVFLRRTGAEVVFANDGLDGVEAFRRGAYDLVFLDIEMPRMDGYEALREMRLIEQTEARRPMRIVALTAHATSEHRERIRQAGFTAHLTKPIRRVELHAVLARPATATERAGGPVFALADDEPLDPELAVLRVQYLQDKQESLAMLREWLSQQRYSELISLGHRWHGSGASYGYPQISALGARLEEAAKGRDATAIDGVIVEAFALLAPEPAPEARRVAG